MTLPMPRFFARLLVPFACGVALCSAGAAGADGGDAADVAAARAAALQTYKTQVQPFMTTYCARCHSGNRQKGGVTFESATKNPGAPAFALLWKRSAAQVKTHSMPPEDADAQPTEPERKAVLDWVDAMKRLSPKDPGQFVIRRLTRVEYGNTLHDLFGVDPQIARDLPDEVFGAGYTNSLSPVLMEQYLAVANEVLNRAIAPPGEPPTDVQRRLLGADPAAIAGREPAARRVAQSFARRAFRRPPADAELDVLMRVFALATDQGKSYPEALRLMVKAVLVSPQFIFITPGPSGPPGTTGSPGTPAAPAAAGDVVPPDEHQLASRLP